MAAPRPSASSTNRVPVLSATKRSPGTSDPRVVVHPCGRSPSAGAACELAELELLDLAPPQRNQGAPPSSCRISMSVRPPHRAGDGAQRGPPRGRRTDGRRRRSPGPARGPCRRSRRRPPRTPPAIAASIAERRSGSISTSMPVPWRISSTIASGSSRARVVARDDDGVRQLPCDPSHQRHACRDRGRLPHRTRRRGGPSPSGRAAPRTVSSASGRVRVVDDDGEVLSLVDRLESAGNAGHGADALDDRVLVDVEQERGRDRAEDVLDVEDAEQRRLDSDARRRERRAARHRARGRRHAPRASGRSPKVTSGARWAPASSSASRRPYGSPTFTAAGGGATPVNRRRFAWKYSSMSPWRSRWSCVEVREDERVEPHPVEPTVVRAVGRGLERDGFVARVEHLPEERCRSIASGVVCGAARGVPPTTHSTVPTSPVRRPSASRIERRRNVVVDLPFVPVTPATASRSRRRAEEHVGRDGHRGPHATRRRAAGRRRRPGARRRARPPRRRRRRRRDRARRRAHPGRRRTARRRGPRPVS